MLDMRKAEAIHRYWMTSAVCARSCPPPAQALAREGILTVNDLTGEEQITPEKLLLIPRARA